MSDSNICFGIKSDIYKKKKNIALRSVHAEIFWYLQV
jgi:hypothetical protein